MKNLETFCRALCESIEGLPPETSKKVWEAFEAYQAEGKPSEEDLRDIYEALVTGLTLDTKGASSEDFATALCALLCEIENGPAEASISRARNNLEKVTRALSDTETQGDSGAIFEAVIEQFNIFEESAII